MPPIRPAKSKSKTKSKDAKPLSKYHKVPKPPKVPTKKRNKK